MRKLKEDMNIILPEVKILPRISIPSLGLSVLHQNIATCFINSCKNNTKNDNINNTTTLPKVRC